MAVDTLAPILDAYLACGEASLTVPVGRAFVQPGAQVAHDDCCKGQLWVRVVTAVPVYPGSAPANCPPAYYQVTLAMGTVRCASVIDDNGVAPTPTELTTDAHAMTQDMLDLMQAITCCSVSPMAVLGTWTPTGPLGGCVGGEWTFTIKMNHCGCLEVTP